MAVFFKEFLYQGFISTETFERVIFFFLCVCSSYNNTNLFFWHWLRAVELARWTGLRWKKVTERPLLGLELSQKYSVVFDHTL